MRIFKKVVICATIVVVLLPFMGINSLRAEGETVNYVFTGLAIPEGQGEVFSVDAGTINLFRQNPAVINVFVAALAEKYNTGTAVIDQAAEVAYLNGVINGTQLPGNHIPVYMPVVPVIRTEEAPLPAPAETPQVVVAGNMEINNGNYIDINITTQTLTLFQNGVGTYAVPVVTGNVAAGHNTPEGLFAVQYKQLDRVLKGEDYESFVHYWMRFVNNCGIHDANWRSNFGGEIYKRNGSHGCVNVPPELMPALYAATPEGTPVWVHS